LGAASLTHEIEIDPPTPVLPFGTIGTTHGTIQ
jgi:hypothetical protein